ncbi:hypothetical protein H310_09207 [Aphanomyces invadans]|uniref:Uncharacterized protein n=1 Tax=Aphanomyces invadans TaxID=157072 RepID=A0A024TUR3_9STRA|nr:hypothetical protein H310_09207 [Aphanomyces invadans]ETV97885.1 hypothetical protein H310_09207 [Aphanomyces invadans]|eukprot:XP_008873446.1 hypothetical protein H310_09207 [Aphanomyces invadans]
MAVHGHSRVSLAISCVSLGNMARLVQNKVQPMLSQLQIGLDTLTTLGIPALLSTHELIPIPRPLREGAFGENAPMNPTSRTWPLQQRGTCLRRRCNLGRKHLQRKASDVSRFILTCIMEQG